MHIRAVAALHHGRCAHTYGDIRFITPYVTIRANAHILFSGIQIFRFYGSCGVLHTVGRREKRKYGVCMGQAGGAAHIMASLAGDTMEVVLYGTKTHETLKRGPFDFAASSSGQAVRLTSAQLYVLVPTWSAELGRWAARGRIFQEWCPD